VMRRLLTRAVLYQSHVAWFSRYLFRGNL